MAAISLFSAVTSYENSILLKKLLKVLITSLSAFKDKISFTTEPCLLCIYLTMYIVKTVMS